MKVLLIDDDDDTREMMRFALQAYGHEVESAASGHQGAELAVAHAPDVVLLDVMMPDMDGPATLTLLRERGVKSRVAFVTASGTRSEVDRLTAMKPDRIMTKPLDPVRLAREVLAMGPTAAQEETREERKERDLAHHAEFDRMRQNFLRRSREQLDRADELLAAFEQGRFQAVALEDLQRVFHRFSGISASFGVPRAGVLGKEGELTCLAVARRQASPTESEIANWRRVVSGIRELVETAPETATAPAPPPEPPAEVAKSVVAVVDADDEVRGRVAQQIASEGFGVREYASAEAALAGLSESLPDAVVADLDLPGGGSAFVESVRTLPEAAELPILAVSPRRPIADKVEVIHCGADALFEEPVDWKSLLRRLRQLLEVRREQPYRILSVEDDPDQAAFLSSMLGAAGHEVRPCADASSFERALQEFDPDLVLMDIHLPGVSGYDLVRFLRQDERYTTLPVIFLTAEDQPLARFRATRAGADDHLVKPVQPPLLMATIAARVERARHLRSLLQRDGLTQLLNHTAFAERAAAAFAHHERDPSRPRAWVMVDVDHFKKVNDTYGHPVGDRVLAGLSALLRRRLRQTDTIGRYGGEEFAILFEGLPEPEVMRLMGRVRQEFSQMEHHAPHHPAFRSTFSAGVAMLKPGVSLDGWRKASDDALYAAKHAGRNQVVAAT
jgi:diguanylate cyclase (GGDEF)-like protein